MELQVIKCSDGYFIKGAKSMRFGAENVKPTWNSEWFKSSQIDEQPFKITLPTKKLIGFSLMEGYAPTEIMPARVGTDFFKDEYTENNNQNVRGLYEPIYEDVPEIATPIEVEFKIIAEVEGELVEHKLSMPVYGTYNSRYAITNQNVKVGLLDEIVYPAILHQGLPCELSSEDSYKIIRTYIKDNIDTKVATITSDYDFCFTVQKKIRLSEKEAYTKDLNFSIFGKKKKPKLIIEYRTNRAVVIYETAPKRDGQVYKGYTMTEPFVGKNLEDLKTKIYTFLNDLITEINRPLVDCPNCKGQGVITE